MTPEERKAAGWSLSHWVVKCGDRYHCPDNSLLPVRFPSVREALMRTPWGEGRAVPVYTRTVRTKRGHSFSWALARMKEGKRVRGGVMDASQWIRREGDFMVDSGGFKWSAHGNHAFATNWELAE